MQNKNFFYPGVAVMFIVATVTLGWIYLVNGTTIGTDIETVNYLGTGTSTFATTTIGTNFYIDEAGNASTTGYLFLADASTTGTFIVGGVSTLTGDVTMSGNAAIAGTTTLATTTIGTNFYIDEVGNASTTGDLLIDTNVFFVDAANDRIGVGTSTLTNLFSVASGTDMMLTITTEGYLGIGNNTPTGILHVATSTAYDALYINTEGNIAIGTTTNAGLFTVGTTSDSIFNITTAGYVGIGTSSPSSVLHVYSSVSDTALIIEQDGLGSVVDLQNATGTVFSIDGAGNLTVDTSTLYVDTANDAVAVGTTTAQGIFTVGSTSDAFFNVTTEGNVAVGTSTAAGVFTVGTTTGDAIFNINTAGGIVVGGGSTAISKIMFGTVAIDPEAIATSSTSVASSTVSGLTTDMQCFVTPPDVLNDDLIAKGATTTASDKLGVYIYNMDQSSGGSDIDDGSLTWGYLCIK